jgi:hypothetical protein
MLNIASLVPNSKKQEETEIELLVTDGKDMRTLLKTYWDIAEFREWISENLNKILREPFPYFFGQDGSIAKCVSSFYDSVNPEDDDLIDRAFNYRRVHGIRFGLRGARIPDIYIGQRCGNLEISSYSKQDEWSYFIYADSFENEMRRLLDDYSLRD